MYSLECCLSEQIRVAGVVRTPGPRPPIQRFAYTSDVSRGLNEVDPSNLQYEEELGGYPYELRLLQKSVIDYGGRGGRSPGVNVLELE